MQYHWAHGHQSSASSSASAGFQCTQSAMGLQQRQHSRKDGGHSPLIQPISLYSGSPAYLHPATASFSAIDLSIAHPAVYLDFCRQTDSDQHGSDHYPIVITTDTLHLRHILLNLLGSFISLTASILTSSSFGALHWHNLQCRGSYSTTYGCCHHHCK